MRAAAGEAAGHVERGDSDFGLRPSGSSAGLSRHFVSDCLKD